MFTTLAVLLTFGSPAPAEIVRPDPTLVAYEKAQLQERNRAESRFIREAVEVPAGLFGYYKNLEIPASTLNRVFDPANHVSEGFHFDPQNDHKLGFEITDKPYLMDRGITEIIGVGVSDFAGSSERRIQNIMTSLQQYDGHIITRGEEFSFNDLLGEVEEENGYAWERTILNGKDSWGLGGGICQVSTNIFRAALNAGLPVSERRAHSFAIGKYEPTGLDATIYKGVQDLRFTNDTPGDILIKVVRRDDHLAVFLLGTKDRSVVLEKTSHWNGYDGRLATHWSRTIKKDQLLVSDNFESHYRGIYD